MGLVAGLGTGGIGLLEVNIVGDGGDTGSVGEDLGDRAGGGGGETDMWASGVPAGRRGGVVVGIVGVTGGGVDACSVGGGTVGTPS